MAQCSLPHSPQKSGLFPGKIYTLLAREYIIINKVLKLHPKFTLTNNDDGVPATARQVWNMMQWSKYWPRPWGTNIWAMSSLSWCHCQTSIPAITPSKDMVVWGKRNSEAQFPPSFSACNCCKDQSFCCNCYPKASNPPAPFWHWENKPITNLAGSHKVSTLQL